jgi:hypothetical protein
VKLAAGVPFEDLLALDEALAALDKAKTLGGKEDAAGSFLLAMIHWQKGEKEQARA